MRSNAPRLTVLFTCLFLFAPRAAHVPAAAEKWKPIDPAELSLTESSIQKDADAEILEWDVRMYDDVNVRPPNVVTEQYYRLKIYTDRGREDQSKVELPYGDNTVIKDLQARTIKKNGTVVELNKRDVYQREVVKTDGLKVKAITFVLPEVEVGAIIEYRWRQVDRDSLIFANPLMFQRAIPARLITKHVKSQLGMRAQAYNMAWDSYAVEKDGFNLFTVRNMPAAREEPYSPPEMQLAAWTLVYYEREGASGDPDTYWKDYGKSVYNAVKKSVAATDAIARAAKEATGDAVSVSDKLRNIVAYCRRRIERTDVDTGAARPKKAKPNESASDVLTNKTGDGADLILLVTAMAQAAGLDARVAAVSSRAEMFSQRKHIQSFLRRFRIVAVRDGDEWQFVDPSNTYEPDGRLRWSFESREAVISDATDPVLVPTPTAEPEYSARKSDMIAKLAEDGTLEADVSVEYTGQWGLSYKEAEDADSAEERQKALTDDLVDRWRGAEITGIRIENVTDPFKPYTQSYHLRFPSCAQRTGSRLLLRPALFERDSSSRFPAERRTNDIYFRYAWSELERVTIEAPAGFAFETPPEPVQIELADVGGARIEASSDGRQLILTRTFSMGRHGALLFPASQYAGIKAFFDGVAKNDGFTVSLIRAADR